MTKNNNPKNIKTFKLKKVISLNEALLGLRALGFSGSKPALIKALEQMELMIFNPKIKRKQKIIQNFFLLKLEKEVNQKMVDIVKNNRKELQLKRKAQKLLLPKKIKKKLRSLTFTISENDFEKLASQILILKVNKSEYLRELLKKDFN